jgi:hypothetical protein
MDFGAYLEKPRSQRLQDAAPPHKFGIEAAAKFSAEGSRSRHRKTSAEDWPGCSGHHWRTMSAERLAFSCEVLRERSDRGPRQLQRPSWAALRHKRLRNERDEPSSCCENRIEMTTQAILKLLLAADRILIEEHSKCSDVKR